MRLLSESNPRELFASLTRALKNGERLPAEELTPHLLHPEESIRRAALELLESSADPGSVPALLE
ncbi:MAG: hypothetical protein PHC88_15320, partial [Terrimicrobiaceae bacterium]|nr:hypothetical protein [Terrimicrobiaceae bacterium]